VGKNDPKNRDTRKNSKKFRLKARFIEDISIPDGSIISPDISYTKIWSIENDGNQKWPEGCKFKFVGGTNLSLNKVDEFPIPSFGIGEANIVSLEIKSPTRPGRYTSYWRIIDSSGNKFGNRFWIDIVVDPSMS